MSSLTLEQGQSRIDNIIDGYFSDFEKIVEESKEKAIQYIQDIRDKGIKTIKKMSFACDTSEIIKYFKEVLFEKVKQFGFRDEIFKALGYKPESPSVKDYEDLYGASAL